MTKISASPGPAAGTEPADDAEAHQRPETGGEMADSAGWCHLYRLFSATTIETVWALHCEKMAQFGFDRLLYGYTRFPEADNFGSFDDIVLLSNHEQAYIDALIAADFFRISRTFTWARNNSGVRSWGDLDASQRANRGEQLHDRVEELNSRFQVDAGYSISFPTANTRIKGAIGLCARADLTQGQTDAIWASHGREIEVLNAAAHLKLASLPYAVSQTPLSERQREVLEWVGEGKTTGEIATIMGLTVPTVEKHLRRAREVLEVDTTAQAVLKAALRDQIFVVRS